MSIYTELPVEQLQFNHQCGIITDKELIEILIEKLDVDNVQNDWLIAHLEDQIDEATKENRRLIHDIKELEQKLEDIRRII